MIYFACKQCGKHFERPEEAAGTLVFCECGTGNRVPWESTMAAPEASSLPDATSMPLDEDREQPPRRRTSSAAGRYVEERDPAYCLNHQDRPSESTCADCQEDFCARCVVTLTEQTLCGPCKNFRIRALQRPARFSVLALFSLLLGLFTGPAGIFCVGISANARSAAPSFLGLLLPVAAVILGVIALREIETKPLRSGRSVAISGIVCGVVTAFLTVVWAMLLEKQLD